MEIFMRRTLFIGFLLCVGLVSGRAQDSAKVWTLQQCLSHALENNIQLQQSRNNYLSGVEDTKQAKAAVFPSISGSVSQGFTNYPSSEMTPQNSYTGNYGVDASMTLFQGRSLQTAIKQQKLQNRIDELSVSETENDIRVSIVTAYLQALYAKEAISVAENTAEASKAQRDRAEELWKAGSLSRVDFAQLESQYASDLYSVVSARTSLDDYMLQLKQLLELEITDEIDVVEPSDEDASILAALPSKVEIYENALAALPEVQQGELDVEAAELALKQAKSGYWPTLSLNAGIGTGHSSNSEIKSQMTSRFNESVGLNLNIPILSGRKNKTAVNKANLSIANSKLDLKSTEKEVLKKVESAYLDVVSSQSQYAAAEEKEKYAEQSYTLTSEQFSAGVKNTVELLTAKNEYFSATQQKLQAKYMALLSLKLLDIYQGNVESL